MPRKRRRYPAELKAKVALEALREGSDDGGTGGPLRCASQHAREYARRYTAERRAQRLLAPRLCPDCQTDIRTLDYRTKRCPPCAKKRNR